jgi:hypothetical protein
VPVAVAKTLLIGWHPAVYDPAKSVDEAGVRGSFFGGQNKLAGGFSVVRYQIGGQLSAGFGQPNA